MTLTNNTTVVLIFDVDVKKEDILYKNIEILEKDSKVKQIVCIPQVKNFEDELMKACKIKKITDLTASSTEREFKSDFIKMNNLCSKLLKYNFDIAKMWNSDSWEGFDRIHNESFKIKITPQGRG
ncbi:MAG: hypothetical protein PUD20_01515, partial [bacterium]|nr:hypothetical protein [bacterium]